MLHKSPADGIWNKYDVLFVSISEVGHFQRRDTFYYLTCKHRKRCKGVEDAQLSCNRGCKAPADLGIPALRALKVPNTNSATLRN